VDGLTVGQAAAQTGWSARMLRYLERSGLVVPRRTSGGYRVYGLHELEQLRGLDRLRRRFQVGLDELAFVVRLRREPTLRAAVDKWLAGADAAGVNVSGAHVASASAAARAWVAWEQDKHERLLAA
jgi:MerR family transcriptional regulator, copper efflux regulator